MQDWCRTELQQAQVSSRSSAATISQLHEVAQQKELTVNKLTAELQASHSALAAVQDLQRTSDATIKQLRKYGHGECVCIMRSAFVLVAPLVPFPVL